jgi:hypothetical protein
MNERIYLFCLLMWVVVGLLLTFWTRRANWNGIGLVLGFFMQLALLHWFGALVSFFPWYSPAGGIAVVQNGFAISTLGLVGFAVGCCCSRGPIAPLSRRFEILPEFRMMGTFLAIGIVCYLALALGLGEIASLSSVLSSGFNFVLVAICLGIWETVQARRASRLFLLMLSAFFFPLFTVMTSGFINFGVGYAIVVVAFVVVIARPRFKLAVAAAPLLFVALSVYVTYMRDREALRQTIWGGESYAVRAERLIDTFRDFEWFDPSDGHHLQRVDARLNQNRLVGEAEAHMTNHRDFAGGETLSMAFLAMVPRALWPGKPEYAGSMDLVSRFTGLTFAEGTSVGIGMIMEFFVNFGEWGVFFGMLIVGLIVATVDRKAGIALVRGEPLTFCRWFLVGMALLNVGGSLAETSATVASSFLLGWGVTAMLRRKPVFAPA